MGTLGRAIYAAVKSIRGAGRVMGRLGSTIHGAEEQVSRARQHRTAMSIFEKEQPRIKKDVFVAPSAAAVTGDVLRASSLRNSRWYMINSNRSGSLTVRKECRKVLPSSVRPSASYSTQASENKPKQERTDLTTIEDPFDAPTYNIPEKPVTFVEGASYSVAILAGLGVAALAGYAVFKELIFEPKEYKIYGKALARVQSDSQVTAKIGYPVTGYGSESRNRAARQRIPNRVWTDEDGVEHVEVNFHVRGPHGAGKVFAEMFKDSSDRTWKFTFLVVEITSPRHAQMMLESYVPA